MTMDSDFKLLVVLEEAQDNGQNWASLHQCLLMLFDSPLNHAGHLEVFIKLNDGRMIKMHREVRIPRTFRRFEQLFCNFLQGCDMPVVQTKDGHARLLDFISAKHTEKRLKDCRKFRISNLAPRVRSPSFFTDISDRDKQLAVYVEFGPVDFNILGEGRETEFEVKTINRHTDEYTYSISRYPLSPALTCVKLATSFEKALDVF